MADFSLWAYVILLLVYRSVEIACMARTGSLETKPTRDWSVALIAIPFLLIIVGPPLERLYFGARAGTLSLALGTVFFAAATTVRAKAHLDLRRAFSMFIAKGEGQKLVQTGLYEHIRHPLYLGNLLLFIACPLFLGARISWALTGLGLLGVLLRLKIEERFLLRNMEGYADYISRTWALIPGVF